MTTTMNASFDYAKAREAMVEQQVRPWEVLDIRVLDVIARMPREAFVDEAYRALAYADMELPIGHGEVMNKPVFEGRALQALQLSPADEVLEIGSGSGYLTACLSRLAREVVGIERHADLTATALARLEQQGIANARVEHADAMTWQPKREFDAICVTGAVDEIPARFIDWLRPGGRLFAVRGRAPAMEAVLLHKDVNGVRTRSLFETELPYLAGAAPVAEFRL